MPRGILQQLNPAFFNDETHSPADVYEGALHLAKRPLAPTVEVALLPCQQARTSASQRAASFLALSEPGGAREIAEGIDASGPPALRLSRPAKTSFMWGFFQPKCHNGQAWGVKDCSRCGDSKAQCSSDDCTMWKGKCISTTLGEDDGGNPIKMGQWKYYWGPSRPFNKTGDWLKFGTAGQVIGPGTGKKAIEETPQEQKDEKPWIVMHFPGNMKYTEVKTLRGKPTTQWDKEPPSKEARSAMAEYQFGLHGDLIAGMGMMKPCDKMGRIDTTSDGTFCEDNQACVTALPADFGKDLGKNGLPGKDFCWRWFTPECKQVECPPPPYCPPTPRRKDGTPVHENHCPPAKPCPKQPPCEKPYWKNICQDYAGQPWCVPPDILKQYRGPIEIQCSATGNELRQKKGSPDGCWWLNANSREDLQRLPGKVNRWYAPPSGVFVQHEKGALSEKQAQKWIQNGIISATEADDNTNSEFLAKAKPLKA